MEHCTIFQSSVSKLSFRRWVTVNHHNYIRFLHIALIPFIRLHHCSGCYWLWMELASAHYHYHYLSSLRFISFLKPLLLLLLLTSFLPPLSPLLLSSLSDFSRSKHPTMQSTACCCRYAFVMWPHHVAYPLRGRVTKCVAAFCRLPAPGQSHHWAYSPDHTPP